MSDPTTTNVPSEMDKVNHFMRMAETMFQQVIGFLPSLAGALAVLVLGCAFIRCFSHFLETHLLSKNAQKKTDSSRQLSFEEYSDDDSESGLAQYTHGDLDPTIVKFGMSIVKALMKVFLVIIACGMIGIKTTSIIAIFTASTLAVGLALKGLITDLANGVMLIVFRPFVNGDRVTVADHSGTVVELSMFRTILMTDDKRMVIIPNSKIDIIEVTTGSCPDPAVTARPRSCEDPQKSPWE